MSVEGIQSGQGPEEIIPRESREEKQKLFELQWEINLLGTYLAVTQKNGNLSHQLKGIEKDLKGGKSLDSLTPALNQLIDQINRGLSSDEAPFPPFDLTSGGNEQKALMQYAISLEKFLNVAGNKQIIQWDQKESLFNSASQLIDEVGSLSRAQAIGRLNQIIEAANKSLPIQLQTLRG